MVDPVVLASLAVVGLIIGLISAVRLLYWISTDMPIEHKIAMARLDAAIERNEQKRRDLLTSQSR